MQQASVCDGLSFDPFPFDEDGLNASEVNVGRRKIGQALVVAQVIVVGDEGADLGLEVARQVVVLEQDSVLERLMPALDLALGHGVIGRAANMVHVLAIEPFGEVGRDVARAVVRQEPWPVDDRGPIQSRGLQRQLERGGERSSRST
jgi:hypothetical protein